ncbi:MAG: hypothetical protein ACTSRU_15980, partial [Candidatus Hodarchaeales archaeon]
YIENRRNINAVCYKNSTDTFFVFEWFPGNITRYVISGNSMYQNQTTDYHSFAISKYDLSECEYPIQIIHSYDSTLYSSIWSYLPLVAANTSIYHYITPVLVLHPAIITSVILLLTASIIILIIKYDKVKTNLRNSAEISFEKSKHFLNSVYSSNIRLFMVSKSLIILNVLIVSFLSHLIFTTMTWISVEVNVILNEVFNTSSFRGLIQIWIPFVGTFLVFIFSIITLTEYEIEHTKSNEILEAITTNLENSDIGYVILLMELLKIIHQMNSATIFYVVCDDLLTKPKSTLTEDIRENLIEIIYDLDYEKQQDTKNKIFEYMEKIYSDFKMECRPKPPPFRVKAAKFWNLSKRSLLVLLVVTIVFPILFLLIPELTEGFLIIGLLDIILFGVGLYLILIYYWREIHSDETFLG